MKNITLPSESRLTPIEELPPSKGKHYWLCRCICGKVVRVLRYKVLSGHSKSCGCYKNDLIRDRSVTHGKAGTQEYKVWLTIKQRCLNPKNPNFPRYGGRGITICERWSNKKKGFANFLEDMGNRPFDGAEVERKNNDGPYSPGNCCWATRTEQCNNRRTTNWVTYQGQTKSMSEWAKETGIPYFTLRARIDKYNWTLERAMTRAVGPKDRIRPLK